MKEKVIANFVNAISLAGFMLPPPRKLTTLKLYLNTNTLTYHRWRGEREKKFHNKNPQHGRQNFS